MRCPLDAPLRPLPTTLPYERTQRGATCYSFADTIRSYDDSRYACGPQDGGSAALGSTASLTTVSLRTSSAGRVRPHR